MTQLFCEFNFRLLSGTDKKIFYFFAKIRDYSDLKVDLFASRQWNTSHKIWFFHALAGFCK